MNINSTITPVLLAAADASKSLIAAPGVGMAIAVQAIHWSIVTAAAQLVKIGVSAGTEAQQLLEFAASASGNGSRFFSGRGFILPSNTALTAVPAAAGPAIHFIIESNNIPTL